MPTLDGFEEAYARHATHGQRLDVFHRAFALFRWAIIFEGIAARAKSGNASDDNAEANGRLAAKFADHAAELI